MSTGNSHEPQLLFIFSLLVAFVAFGTLPYMRISEAYNLFLTYGRGERNYARETLVKLQDCFERGYSHFWVKPKVENLSRMDIAVLRNAMRDKGLGAYRQYSVIMALKVFCKFCRRVLGLNCIDPDKETPLSAPPEAVRGILDER
jgi:hypothetical protein